MGHDHVFVVRLQACNEHSVSSSTSFILRIEVLHILLLK